jgi:excisionase family DNA binding protein
MVTQSKPETPRLAYSPDEAARALGVGRTTIYDLMSRGALKRAKIGARTVIPAQCLEDYLKANTIG